MRTVDINAATQNVTAEGVVVMIDLARMFIESCKVRIFQMIVTWYSNFS